MIKTSLTIENWHVIILYIFELSSRQKQARGLPAAASSTLCDRLKIGSQGIRIAGSVQNRIADRRKFGSQDRFKIGSQEIRIAGKESGSQEIVQDLSCPEFTRSVSCWQHQWQDIPGSA